jgi:phosphoglycerate dehydrogenase-like enzyme
MDDSIFVLITEPFSAEILETLRSVSSRLDFHLHPAHSLEEIPPPVLMRTEVLYTLRLLPPPEQVPNLKWVQFHMAGLDQFTDHPLLEKGVQFTSLSGAAAPQMAEYTLMLLLALGHRLPDLQLAQARHEWPREKWRRFAPRELREATVGVVGYGSVGREVARLCRAYGARVLAVKRNVTSPEDRGYSIEGMGDPEGRIPARIYPPQALGRMLGECDFVVISAPLTGQTRGTFGAEMISKMKDGACLVNISRGRILQEDALRQALLDGKLAGAALDVFAEEPLPAESPLWDTPNLILSPHIAGDSPAYDRRAAELFAENLRRFLEDRPLINLFDPEKGY